MGEWIPHDGTSRPVPADTLVRVKFRYGGAEGDEMHPSRAEFWGWTWGSEEHTHDIVAYRLAKVRK